ncbi:histone-lysine N-methyltransferase, H3 lysine-79 specific [Solenopsis invicta]|uniref:histone-lysine N-methyltransferase, H3 lysine-79 specific n=1 Tax=Solenopsis invicta TaxID=13686 RepID=UPI00193E89E0|nr:histone-lysine N-methyltransferase, H3 lysine-79 specific [Solenopsis invicta]
MNQMKYRERSGTERDDEEIQKILREEGAEPKRRQIENIGFRKRKRKKKEERMEMERRKHRGSQGDKISWLHATKKRRRGETYKGKTTKSNNSNEKDMELGERIFKEDFRRRIKMFEALVGSVALYGAEVWGWRDEKTLDGIKRKYAKWILNLDRGTPNYILLEETKMEEIRIQAIKRALRYEEKARQSAVILLTPHIII